MSASRYFYSRWYCAQRGSMEPPKKTTLIFFPWYLFVSKPSVAMASNILVVPLLGGGSHYIAMDSIATEMLIVDIT